MVLRMKDWGLDRVGGLPKKGGPWTVCRFKGGGGLGKREGVVFLKGD